MILILTTIIMMTIIATILMMMIQSKLYPLLLWGEAEGSFVQVLGKGIWSSCWTTIIDWRIRIIMIIMMVMVIIMIIVIRIIVMVIPITLIIYYYWNISLSICRYVFFLLLLNLTLLGWALVTENIMFSFPAKEFPHKHKLIKIWVKHLESALTRQDWLSKRLSLRFSSEFTTR